MSVTDVVLHQGLTEIHRPQTAAEVQAFVNRIQEVMRQVMKAGVHYGTVPGAKKPSLFKPGAEKIATTFRLAIDPEVQELSAHDEIRFRVFAEARSQLTGVLLGRGVGECSTNEEKYRWRKAVCKEEFDETPEDRRRVVWKSGGKSQKAFKVQQVRTNPADLANTVLKMAKKRALIDVVLTVTAASDVFEQDIEDLPEEIVSSIIEDHDAVEEHDDRETEEKISQGFAMLGIKEDEQKKLRAEFTQKALHAHLVDRWKQKQSAEKKARSEEREPGAEG